LAFEVIIGCIILSLSFK